MDEKVKDRDGGPRPLTPEHRHLLRMKAYSFPFLCEKSWYNCDDEDDDDDSGQGEVVADEGIDDCANQIWGQTLYSVSKSFHRRNFMQHHY